MRPICHAFVLLAVLAAAACAESRTWTDVTGRFSIKAEYLGQKDGKVQLKTADGRTVAVSIDKLSEADRHYIAGLAKNGVLKGEVIRIIDGDTIVLLVDRKQIHVRLEGIDCPEASQGFATVAKRFTASLCFRKTVEVEQSGQDKYGRTLGYVKIDDRVVNDELLKAGLAWHFRKYNSSATLAKYESSARRAKVGIWSEKRQVAPWDWRDWDNAKRQDWLLERGEFASAETPARPIVIPSQLPTGSVGNYWLNTNSGIRHNRSCKYFDNTKEGRFCGAGEGRGCKICGG